MSIAEQIVAAAKEQGVVLHVEDGKLAYIAERGAFSAQLKADVRAHRDAIIALLQARQPELHAHASNAAPRLVAVPRGAALPLSHAQHQVWLADQLEPRSGRFNLPIALRLRGRLREDALQQAFDELVRRHEILRTVYVRSGNVGAADAPVQHIGAPRPVEVERVDLRALSAEQQEAELARYRRREATRGFDLESDLMLRVCLLQTRADEVVALFTMHHIASDGWSMGLLVREFVEFYTACAERRPARCVPLDLHYADFASWQRRCLDGGLRQAQLDYWTGQLANTPRGPTLPTDKPRASRTSLVAGIHVQALGAALSTPLREFAARRGTTLFIVLQTAFALLIGRFSGSDDVVIGTPVAGRTQKALEPMLGLFVNLLALRSRFAASDTFDALLRSNTQMILDAYAHQDIPFDVVVEHAQAERDLRVFPLFQVVFNLQNVGREELVLPDLKVSTEIVEAAAKFDLEITVEEASDGLYVRWKYAADLFEAQSVAQLAAAYGEVLQAIIADPQRELAALTGGAAFEALIGKPRLAAAASSDASAEPFAFVEAAGATELRMAALWQQVLGHERISATANFFDLGGNSLKAMRLATLVAEQFEVEQSVRALFEHATIAALSRHVDALRPRAHTRIPRAPAGRPLPLSFAQQRLWFIDQLHDGSSQYNMPIVLRLRGALDRDALQKSLDAIVARHAVLRTVFVQTAEGPAQVVQPWSPWPLPVRDLRALAAPAQAAAVTDEARAEAARVFDLSRDRMLRGRLLALSEREHVLILVVHHIAADGQSMGVLRREFAALYQAFAEGREPTLAALEIQYADYANWQREAITQQRLEGQWQYWQNVLRGAPAVHNLPLDKPRPPQQQFAGALHRCALGAGLRAALAALGKRNDATLFMVLQAAFALLLSRWSQEHDIVLGSPIAGRTSSQVEDLIGFFVNTIVFRYDLAPDKRFDELLQQARRQVLDAQSHQDIPFEMLVDRLQPERSLSHNPIMQVLFTLQNQELGELAELDLAIEGIGGVEPVTKFDLELTAFVQDDALYLEWCYARSLFDHRTIERMAASFEVLLHAIVAAPQQRLHELPVLDAQQRETILVAFNDTACEFPADALVHGLIEAVVDANPDAIAVVYEQHALSYAELNARANQVAHYLLAAGVKPDDRVAICAERSLDLVIGLLGILKAGAAYVPLDPSYPAERLAYMLEDSAPRALLTQTRIYARLPACPAQVLLLDEAEHARSLAAQPRRNPDPRALGLHSLHLAYVIYTSGSTGLPKGAMNEHRALVNRLLWAKREFALGSDDRVLQKTPFGFDVSVWELFLPLLAGAQLVMARPGGHQEPDYLVDLIAAAGITTLHFVPSMLPAFLAQAEPQRCRTLRRILCSGEALPYPLQQQVLQQLAHVELHNLYGPTEAAIDVTSWRCTANAYAGIVPIGRPIANTQIRILDAYLQPVPIGARGELYIGGVGVARGYLHRAELTRERFVADPFSTTPGARMYKTGDIARWLPDGVIEYLGRNDFQVKIRGQRIELGEIEARLGACAGVREAVVIACQDAAGDPRLVAYLVMHTGGVAQPAELRAQLATALPEFMLPAAFVTLAALPLTPNGKLDRQALPAPDFGAASMREYVAPSSATERSLCEIWQALLKLDRVGVRDSFFEIGGHSLLAARATNLIAERLRKKVPVRVMFERTTIAELAAYVESLAEHEQIRIPVVERDRPLPLSFAQQRLWFIDRLAGASPQYNMPIALRLTGILDRRALQRSLAAIAERHAILRTLYAATADGPVQIVQPATELRLPVLDLSGLDEAAKELAVAREIRAEAARVFDLARDVAWRARLLELAPRDHVLLLTLHHIAADGWSIGLLTREFAALYAAHREAREAQLPGLALQYADYAHWQRSVFAQGDLEAQWRHWQDALCDAPVVHSLPLDRARPPQAQFAGASIRQRLDAAMLAGLKQLAAGHGATLFVVLQTAFAVLLSRWSNESDVLIGSPVAGRTQPQLEALIGCFVNMLAFRHRLSADLRFDEALANAQRQTLDAYANQDIPFEMLVERLQIERSLAHSPVFQIVFMLQNHEQGALVLPELEARLLSDSGEVVRFDLELAANEGADALWLNWNYSVSLFDADTIQRLADGFELLLRGVLADDSSRIADLPILSSTDAAQLAHCSTNDGEYPDTLCIHMALQHQAARTPDAIAVVCGDATLTYAELDSKSNRVAHALIARGVRPDQPVGISIERSLDMIVAVFAILKAGAAYVPLDTSYPPARLRDMLEDSGAELVLTQCARIDAGLMDPARCIALDDAALLARYPDTDPAVEGLTPDNLAYVIYTSGSTGKPKGTAVPHRGVMHLMHQPEYMPLGPNTRMAQPSAFAFDSSVFEIFGALLNGGTLILYPEHRIDVANLSAFLRRYNVNTLWLTAALFEVWAAHVSGRDDVVVKHLLVGGDVVSPRAVEKIYALDSGVTLVNGYGPTENTVFTACHVIARDDVNRAALPIGRPVRQTRLHVLDSEGRPVPIGVPGELHVGGAGLARGYWRRSELTAEKFVCLPSGERVYRTGDIVRFLSDGTLSFVGRVDHQVKIRGFRVEPGEIVHQLLRSARAAEALVTVDGSGAEKRLVAYVVPHEPCAAGQTAEFIDALRAELKQTLAEYLVPSAFVVLDAFPITPNGKVDRAALPKVDFSAYTEARFVAPSTETETALAGIWRRVLGLDKVGITVDFFQVGGNSLSMTRLQNEIRRAYGINVPLKALFSRTTIYEQAQLVAGLAVSMGAAEAGTEEMIEELF